jgi:DNA primase
MQLPDGALKLQLMSEIADLVQLSNRELTDLWHPKPAGHDTEKPKRYKNDGDQPNEYGGYSQYKRKKQEQRPSSGNRTRPASRADHAARILLGDMAALEVLSAEDHTMLCELPAPHGPLFVWLEGQLHEHGPQPWVALREGLHNNEGEELALRLMAADEMAGQDEAGESAAELRNLLDRMLIERIKQQQNEAIAASKADPTALQHYRELQVRRLKLEAALTPTV